LRKEHRHVAARLEMPKTSIANCTDESRKATVMLAERNLDSRGRRKLSRLRT
jgi:hypothetical protein